MTNVGRQRLLRSALLLSLIAYPFIVYFLLDRAGAGVLGVVLVGLLTLRHHALVRRYLWLGAAAAVAVLLFLGLETDGSEQLLRFYPAGISLALLLVFAASLLRPPTVVERIAAATGTEITPAIRRYVRNVTLAWCGFFVFNGLISGYLALAASMRAWAFYNGFLSYMLMGMLFAAEYLVRRRVIARQQATAATGPRLPEVLHSTTDGDTARYELRVPADLCWFDGHFPGQPVLPGVVQVDWAIHFAREAGLLTGSFKGLPRIKFSAVIEPEARLQLSLKAVPSGVRFSFESYGRLHSGGSIACD